MPKILTTDGVEEFGGLGYHDKGSSQTYSEIMWEYDEDKSSWSVSERPAIENRTNRNLLPLLTPCQPYGPAADLNLWKLGYMDDKLLPIGIFGLLNTSHNQDEPMIKAFQTYSSYINILALG